MIFVPESPPREAVLADLRLMEERVDARVGLSVPDASDTLIPGARLDHILDSGVLQVGYRPNNLPCSFLTPEGKLVGFDVEMAHILAQDIGTRLEFVPFEFDRLHSMLNSGQIDMAMSCIASLPDRYAMATFSRAYLDLTLAFIVPDHERRLYADVEQLRQKKDLTIALVSSHYFEPKIRSLLPDANIVFLAGAEDFFNGGGRGADALLLSAEEGAAYSYRYPRYTVVKAQGGSIRLPAGYAVPKGDIETMEFVSNWIDLKTKEGTVDQLYDYWMLGGIAKPREHRWSVIRDVLGWVD
jgi:ABC-type amino acid transport substrate-binding protein